MSDIESVRKSFSDLIKRENDKGIYLIKAENVHGEQCFFFIQCQSHVLSAIRAAKEPIDLYDERITILRDGMGEPTEEDFLYMKQEHDFMPDKPKGIGR